MVIIQTRAKIKAPYKKCIYNAIILKVTPNPKREATNASKDQIDNSSIKMYIFSQLGLLSQLANF
jgi:hypothetical protein